MLAQLLEEFDVCLGHLFQLAAAWCRLDKLFLAVFDLELDLELGFICGLYYPVLGDAFLDDFLVVAVALEEDLPLRGGDLEVPLVVRVEEERDLADLTVKAILLDLELPIVL